ncbi:uncharacterized protein Dwil_GK10843 [Drosophila willistoni]|uniref:MYND-type domain-containing protein n=1 Tax=Drosophila willistoni TaxID=7260 RepID=B4NA12_DROWI|nr:uncharacterized protein LOC6647936 [Drosophila willistoni]EDW81767.2 uncharacterized protein Dwil_GK10843 [Drosophila willistoni]
MDEVLKEGKCVLCANRAELTCQRCGDFYCSTNCQRRDWQRHRYICFPMPALVYPQAFSVHHIERRKPDPETVPLQIDADKNNIRPEGIIESQVSPTVRLQVISDKDDDLKSVSSNSDSVSNNILKKTKNTASPPKMTMPASHSVFYVNGFRSPNRCFIREASEKTDKAHASLLEKVNTLANNLPKLCRPKYQYALAVYNGKLQRVEVLSGTNSLRVLFLDMGVIEVRQANTVFEINDEIMSLPCYTQQVQLKGVSNYRMHNNVKQFLTQFEGKRFVGVYDNNNYNQMELFHAETKNSLNEEIKVFCANEDVYDLFEGKTQGKNDNKEKIQQLTEKTEPNDDIASDDNNPIEVQIVKAKANDTKTISQLTSTPKDSLKETQEAEPIKEIQIDEADDDKVDLIVTKEKVIEVQINEKEIASNKKSSSSKDITTCSDKPSTSKGVSKSSNEPVLIAPFKTLRFESNTLEVFIVDNSAINHGVFGAFDKAHGKMFTDLQAILDKFVDSEPYEPVLKEYVIVKSDGCWCRAKVTQIDPPYYKVRLLEFTNMEKVTSLSIRRYPLHLDAPCVTNLCIMDGVSSLTLNQTQKAHLAETFKVNNVVGIDGVTYRHDMAMVQCKKVLEKLREMIGK